MNILKENQLSIRALHAVGIVCFVRYCTRNRIRHPYLDAFVDHMWTLCGTSNLPDWDKAAWQLDITGLGDPLPPEILETYPKHAKTLETAANWLREITGTQIYGVYQPTEALRCFSKLVTVSGVTPSEDDMRVFASSVPDRNGWGAPVQATILAKWKSIAAV